MANETNSLMSDQYYSAEMRTYTSADGAKIYAPKKWEDNELVEKIEMNNIEQGIQIAIEKSATVEETAQQSLNRIEDYFNYTIAPEIEDVTRRMDNLPSEIEAEVNSSLSTNNSNIIQTFRNLLGTNYVNGNTLPLTLGSEVATVDARLTELYSAIFGNGSNNNITQLQTDLSNLDTYVRGASNANSLINQIVALQNELGGGNSGTSFKSKIESAIGRPLEPTAAQITANENLSHDLLFLIEEIQDFLGLKNSSSGDSIVDQIDDLNTAINQLKGVLGIEGGTSGEQSNLIDKINDISISIYGSSNPANSDLGEGYNLAKVLDDLYGVLTTDTTTGITSRAATPLINTLKNLPTSFNTLSTRIGAVEADNTNNIRPAIEAMSAWGDIVEKAYIEADYKTYENEDETYLRLIRDDTVQWPATVADMANETVNTYIPLPKGGGGGTTSGGTAIVTRITNASLQILIGKTCNLEYRLEARQNDGSLASNGTATWFVGGIQVATSPAINVLSGEDTETINTFDISPYLSVGTNNIRLQISVDTGGETPTIVRRTWTVNVINFDLIWDYNEATVYDSGTITLTWVPYGANINKTTHIYIDKGSVNEIHLTQTTTQSGITQTYEYEHNLSHGIHTCEMYLTATINGQDEETLHQSHDLIIVQPSNTTPIISSSKIVTEMEQYDTVALPIVVYTPNSTLTSTVILAVDGTTVDTWSNVDRTVHYWNYSPSTAGQKTLTITVDSVVKTINIKVNNISINNSEVSGYNFKIKASDIVSNTDLQNLQIDGKSLIFSSNFDWVNGGLKTERDLNNNIQQYICIKAGTTLTIPYQLFKNNNPALTSSGFNFKIIFKITNCSDYNAEFLDCLLNNIGIKMAAHNAFLSSNTFYTADARLATQYSEDSYIELEFDIYPQNTDDEGKTIAFSFADCWIDGVLSSIKLYDASTSFDQMGTTENPYKNITIGSENCDVYLYLIKSYNKRLSFNDHIANFIADAPNATQMKARYNRNDILDNDEINYEKLIEKNGDCRVWLYEIPYMTIGKKDKVLNCTFQQKWGNGNNYFNDLRGKGTMTVQGTSSVKYIKGAANTDINFTELVDGNGNNLMANGTEDETYGNNWYVEDSENPGHAKIYTVQEGEQLGPECIAVARDSNNRVTQYIKALGYKISENSTPITYSNTKVNFASCEQVNNMCNAAWYQRFNPYPSLTPRDCMEFSMGVQFIKDKGEQLPDADHFRLFPNDNKFHFYSIANMGNSKKNIHVFHDLSNPNEVCIEVNDNDKDQMVMVNDDLSAEDWSGDVYFGMRYPDTKNPSQAIRNAWQRLVSWMAASNPNAATNASLGETVHFEPYTFKGHDRAGTQVLKGITVNQYAGDYTTDSFEYRMAKMLSECEDYMVMDSFVYHFLYLERHTMVDNVSKNNFWSSTDLIHWDLSKAYDMDTSDGNNNQGAFEFDYGNEYNDDRTGGGGKVFNGARSVWFVFVANLKEACSAMFTNREALGAWSSIAYQDFLNTEQQKIPERIWNACYKYDYIRTYPANDWINFLAGGKKTHQRKHYEYFEELYDSSKYRGTVSTSQSVNFRAYTPTQWAGVPPKKEVTITMYNKMYISIDDGTTQLATIKAERGVPVTIDFSGSSETGNTLIALNTASMLQSISGLEQLYSDTCNFSAAVRLRELTIGSLATGYQNALFNTLSLANNILLERLYVQNLTNANFSLDLSHCPALKYLDARGSGFTGYIFADGGKLEEAYLNTPSTIMMNNLRYITDEKLHISNNQNLQYITINNCPQIDSFNRVQTLDSLLSLNLLSVNWRVQGIEFKDFVNYVKNIPSYSVTGRVELTPEMGTFTIDSLEDTFDKDLKFYYYNINDPDAVPQPYYTVAFYGLYGEFIRNQYIESGGRFNGNTFNNYFTNEYIENYNISKNPSWATGADTRLSFGSWDKDDTLAISGDLDVYAQEVLQYKLTYVMHTSDPAVFLTNNYAYYAPGETITKLVTSAIEPFVRDYYKYTGAYWTATDNRNADPTAFQTEVPSIAIKQAEPETWYAVYQKNPNTYTISIYNTDREGNKQGAPLFTLSKKVISANNDETVVKLNELTNYTPGIGSAAQDKAIYINSTTMYQDDINQEKEEDRMYRFLDWQPYIPTAGLRVTGDMDILAKYYKKDDVFTNYFLNKLVDCTLANDITVLPEGAFLHNSNLEKLTTRAGTVGKGSFSYFTRDNRKIFIFTNNNIVFDTYCFYGINNALIIFNGTGNVTINDNSFDNIRNCTIIIPNSNEPISTNGYLYNGFSSFYNNNNSLYVTSDAANRYITNNVNDRIPYNLNGTESYRSRIFTINSTNIQTFLEEAGL